MRQSRLASTIETVTLVWIFFVSCCDAINNETYIAERNRLLNSEAAGRVGASIKLTDKEERVNTILMAAKSSEIEAAQKSGYFPPAMHFFRARDIIDRSVVFDIIRSMPKGGILHSHDSAILDLKVMIKNMTYGQPYLFMCFIGRKLFLRFAKIKPPYPADCEWKKVDDERKAAKSAEIFDNELHQHMSLIVQKPEEQYPSQPAVWKRFLELFSTINGLIYYKPTIKVYWYNVLSMMLKDNVQYLEARSNLTPLYDLDGVISKEATIEAIEEAAEEFVKDHPLDFIGLKLIGSSSRASDARSTRAKVEEAIRFRQKYPTFYAGYDLVGQEDPGHTLLYFIDDLLLPSQQSIDLPYFFHAGETDWYGLAVDDNLVDAVLLNSSRIGHAFAILKHPKVAEIAKNRGIAVELNPVSNQVLKLVSDIRNHPGAELIANDFPVVIASDDPGFWGALPLSHDFYEAFMGLAPADADLSLLKQLAINSIKYSAMKEEEKTQALKLWSRKWDIFLDSTISRFRQ